MKWFLVKLIFSIDAGKNNKAQFDEQLRLVSAVSETDAYFKGKEIGRNQQSQFANAEGDLVSWNFVGVNEVVPLNEIKDGVELYSSTIEVPEKENFINSVLQKGIAIQSKTMLLC
jgi:hypothetical protein